MNAAIERLCRRCNMVDTFDADSVDGSVVYGGTVGSAVETRNPRIVNVQSYQFNDLNFLEDSSQNFGDNSDISGFVKYNDGSKVSASIENGCLVITKAGDVTSQHRGFAKPNSVPSGDFTAICEVTFNSHFGGGGGQKLVFSIFEDPTNTSKKAAGPALFQDNGTGYAVSVTGDKSSDSTNSGGEFLITNNITFGVGIYTFLLRIIREGSTYKMESSIDGRQWFRTFTGTLDFTPTAFGWYMSCGSNIGVTIPYMYVYDGLVNFIFGNSLQFKVYPG